MAREFNGVNTNYLSIGDVSTIDFNTVGGIPSFTIACWFRPGTVDGTERPLMSKANFVISQVQWLFAFSSANGLIWQVGDAGGVEGASTGTADLLAGRWYAGVGTRDAQHGINRCWFGVGGGNKVYRNVTTITRGVNNTGQSYRIGVRNDGNGGSVNGRIAHASIWRCALTDDDCVRFLQGENPFRIRREEMAWYSALPDTYGTAIDERGGFNGSMNGTVPPLPGPWLPDNGESILTPGFPFTGALFPSRVTMV